MSIYHYTYKVINNITQHQYIGVRSCDCIPKNDDYMGSSKYLLEDISNYGKDSFTKEIISIHPTRELAVKHEIELHNRYDVARNSNFYNRSKQTSTKFDTTGVTWVLSEKTKKKMSAWQKGKPKKYQVWNKGISGVIKASKETRMKMSESRIGKKWYHNYRKEILLSIDEEVPNGYSRGRLPGQKRKKRVGKNSFYK